MNYYWFNREKLFKNAWDEYHNKGGKQKPAKYYAANQEVLREVISNYRNKYRNLSEMEKNKRENIKGKEIT